jgi:hypothetical protein
MATLSAGLRLAVVAHESHSADETQAGRAFQIRRKNGFGIGIRDDKCPALRRVDRVFGRRAPATPLP